MLQVPLNPMRRPQRTFALVAMVGLILLLSAQVVRASARVHMRDQEPACASPDSVSGLILTRLHWYLTDTASTFVEFRQRSALVGADPGAIAQVSDSTTCAQARDKALANAVADRPKLPMYVFRITSKRYAVADTLMRLDMPYFILADSSCSSLQLIRY